VKKGRRENFHDRLETALGGDKTFGVDDQTAAADTKTETRSTQSLKHF